MSRGRIAGPILREKEWDGGKCEGMDNKKKKKKKKKKRRRKERKREEEERKDQ